MPRRKRETDISTIEAETEAITSLEGEIESANLLAQRSGLEETDKSNVIVQRDNFDIEAANLLLDVKRVLQDILRDSGSDSKAKLSASKLVLQVNGLLERRQSVDQETMTNLLAALTRRSPVSIRDVTTTREG